MPLTIPTPKSVAQMDPNYERQLRSLRLQAEDEADKRTQGNQARWLRPDNWGGDLFNPEAMSAPFDRTSATNDFIAATSRSDKPGTTGDDLATATMADCLATLERAWRMRHLRGPRALAHALARRRGHGNQRGPLVTCSLEYIRRLLRLSKQTAAEPLANPLPG